MRSLELNESLIGKLQQRKFLIKELAAGEFTAPVILDLGIRPGKFTAPVILDLGIRRWGIYRTGNS